MKRSFRRANYCFVIWGGWLTCCCGLANVSAAEPASKPKAIDIGTRLELFVDDFLIASRKNVELQLQKPQAHDVAIVYDAPWEGNVSGYITVFQDGDKFRMYYRGAHFDENNKTYTPEYTCYAESLDGITWVRPKLGLYEFRGSKENNIILSGVDAHNFTPWLDTNPQCPPEARYKAVGGQKGVKDLRAYQSADGVRWKLMREEGVVTEGDFDSQNTWSWSPITQKYYIFLRKFRPTGRDIMVCTSTDFLNWSKPTFLKYDDNRSEELYTNAIHPYARAPHLWIGFPTRYYGKTQQVEPIFMTSRDGLNFHRWPEPLIPMTAPKDRAGNRSNYMVHGLLFLPSEPTRMSVYATEAYYTGPASRVRRFSFRRDGFVALHAGEADGEVVTKPLTFQGKTLMLNYQTSEGGRIQVELQDDEGKPLSGYTLADCQPLSGDTIEGPVTWKSGSDLSALAGREVRLRLVIKQANVYAMRFSN